MGFLSDISSGIGNVASAVSPFNFINGQVNQATGENQDFGAMIPNVNPAIGTQAQNELDTANQYTAAVPQNQQLGGGLLQDQASNQLNQQQAQAKTQSNSQGQLYSGTTQNNQSALQSNALGQLSNQRMQLNNQIQSQANNMQTSAINAKLGYTQAQNQRQSAQYGASNQGYQNRFNLTGSLLGGAGGVAGLLGGNNSGGGSGSQGQNGLISNGQSSGGTPGFNANSYSSSGFSGSNNPANGGSPYTLF